MRATIELISKLIDTAYAGAVEGISIEAVKVDAIRSVFRERQPQSPETIQAESPVKINVIKAIAEASPAELKDLEAKLLAAERAPHLNGEAKELELAVNRLTNRIKF